MDWKERYNVAHQNNFKELYPTVWKDGLYSKPTYPKVNTSNGLTNAICNYINWNGYVATRINVSGRLVEGTEKVTMGTISKKKWIKSSTTKGTSDISATIQGRSVQIEIKVGKDRPRPEQLKMQERIRAAGGIYEFISDMDSFYDLYDSIVNT